MSNVQQGMPNVQQRISKSQKECLRLNHESIGKDVIFPENAAGHYPDVAGGSMHFQFHHESHVSDMEEYR
ncbi:MAG: hypothetical protein NTX50_13220, partial [Candidatus Sumerlaeota bacterium]|nr:hypothetical protein [Candidatus Sumerlaeota bacterium]